LINITLTRAYLTRGKICIVEATNSAAISVPGCLYMGISYSYLCYGNLKQAEKNNEKQPCVRANELIMLFK